MKIIDSVKFYLDQLEFGEFVKLKKIARDLNVDYSNLRTNSDLLAEYKLTINDRNIFYANKKTIKSKTS